MKIVVSTRSSWSKNGLTQGSVKSNWLPGFCGHGATGECLATKQAAGGIARTCTAKVIVLIRMATMTMTSSAASTPAPPTVREGAAVAAD